jgi:VCBS repeat-containing protein
VWTFTPADPNWFGSDSFTVTVTDDLGGTTNQVVNITLANVDDSAVISGDISYNGNQGDAVGGDMDATDVDGLTDGTYFTVSAQGPNGTAAIDPASGVWTFTPTDPNWFGSDSFTVTVTDDLGGTTNQIVNITLANSDSPAVITGDTSYTGNQGNAVGGDLDAADPDGLTDGTYYSVSGGSHGTAAIDPETGEWTYTPDPGWFGTDSFTVTVEDDLGGTTTQVVNVTLSPMSSPVDPAPDPDDDTDTELPPPPPPPPDPPSLPDPPPPDPYYGNPGSPPPPDTQVDRDVSLEGLDSIIPDDEGSPPDMAAVFDDLIRGLARPETIRATPGVGGFFSPEALIQSLDRIQQEVDLTALAAKSVQGNLIVGVTTGLTVSVFAGYVIWAFRGASLLVGAVSAMPMWRCFDPLPVLLGRDKKGSEEEEEMTPEVEDAEDNVNDLLGIEQMDSSRQVVIPEEASLM